MSVNFILYSSLFSLFLSPSAVLNTMAPLLFSHLAASLSRQVLQMSRMNVIFSLSAASAYRSLWTPTSARQTLLSSTTVTPSPFLPGSSAQCRPSLLGQCQHLPSIQSTAGLKTRSALRKRCKDCFFVRRRGHLYVYCKTHPRHKQKQG